jgi:3',5'-cyclic AMP phosphodiesterase CpdA
MNLKLTRRDFIRRAVAGFAMLSGVGATGLTWPARGSDRGAVRLVFYTDVHARLEWETPQALAKAAGAINARKADLVIAGGDLITDGFASSATNAAPRWDAYMTFHRAIEADLFPAIGNHDLVAANPKDGTPAAENPRSVFLQRMGLDRTYYSFDAVGYHFVLLDAIQVSRDTYQYRGTLGAEQLKWLKHDLAQLPKTTPIVLVTHIPLLTAFYSAVEGATFAAPPNRVVVNNRDVLDLIETHNIILVLQGHLHVKELIRWKNTAFIVGGAVCGKWWRGAWHGTGEGFNIVTLSGNRVDWEYVGYGWQARRPPNR